MSGRCDVAIVGGGPVGATLAVSLRRWPLSVALIDPSPAGGIDARSIALSHGSARFFRALGQWDEVRREATPILEVHVSRRGGFGFTRLRAEECGVEALGYVVAARSLEGRLNTALGSGSGSRNGGAVGAGECERIRATVDAVEVRGRDALVSGRGPDGPVRVEARLVVGADGADSVVRRAAGLPLRVHRCDHVAIAGDLAPERPHRGRAFERFTERGPLAVLPRGRDRCGFVWAVPESVASGEGFGDRGFGARLAESFGSRLGRLDEVTVRVRHPLRVCHSPRITAPRTVLVGNAANALHPVGAQGFNLGLRDVEVLGRALGEGSVNGADPAAVLDRYALERRADHGWARLLTAGLLRVYGSRAPLVPVLGFGRAVRARAARPGQAGVREAGHRRGGPGMVASGRCDSCPWRGSARGARRPAACRLSGTTWRWRAAGSPDSSRPRASRAPGSASRWWTRANVAPGTTEG